MNWLEVCARRLDRHRLSTPDPDARPADIVRAICGAHAQVLSAAELSIGLRTTSLTRTDVQHALWTDRSLVKTYGPRGTLHLLPADDLPMWTGALSAIPPGPSPFPPDVRLTPEQTDEVVAAVGAALDGAELTLDELTEAVVARTGAWAGDRVMPAFQDQWPRWRQAMHTAAHRGVLVFAPNRGRKVTYTSPGIRPMAAKAALAAVIRDYLRAYGPATPQNFAQWLGAPRRWAADLFQIVDMAQVDDAAAPDSPPSGVRLLPYFDAYAVGCQPRDLLFPGRAAQRALSPSGQAGNYPVLLVAGTVAGVWHLRRSGRRLDITVEPFRRLTAAQRRELDDQAARIGEFFGGTAQLTIGTVTAGPHA